jgi:hypothetical protein
MDEPRFEFAPDLFLRVLAVTLGLLCVGWVGAIWLYGRLSTVDMVGSLICAPIVAYLVHVWIAHARKCGPDD